MTGPINSVIEAIRGFRYRYSDEDQLQEGLAAALTERGFAVEREVRLDDRSRIDLVVERVGIEVKVAGPSADVGRQVARYAESDLLDAIVIVTNRARHIALGVDVSGKPVVVVPLMEAGL